MMRQIMAAALFAAVAFYSLPSSADIFCESYCQLGHWQAWKNHHAWELKHWKQEESHLKWEHDHENPAYFYQQHGWTYYGPPPY